MFNLFFGIIWTCLSLVFFSPFLFAIESGAEFIIIFPIIFIGSGVALIVIGLKKVLINYKTYKNGEICYGKVLNIERTGSTVLDYDEYKADFLVYVESKCACEKITEVIGFNRRRYPINSFVKVKYYNGDINIICRIYDVNECSCSAQYYLNEGSAFPDGKMDTY